MDHHLSFASELEDIGRAALASITLHCASRPWKETSAWTVQFAHPRVNVFASGDNNTGTIVANLLTENLKPIDKGIFYSDVVENLKSPRRSVVDFKTDSFLKAVEIFYANSEQRPVRFFWHGEEDLVMISAQPDCDLEWLHSLDSAAIQRLDQDVELSLLERRQFRFECGCNHDRISNFILPIFKSQADELFCGDQTISVACPRCGAKHILSRESLEAKIENSDQSR
jgi:molecular chaperone Hsp33